MRLFRNKYFLLASLFIVYLTTLFTCVSLAHANSILLQEDFNDNNVHDGQPTSWTELNGSGNWQVINGEYIGTINPSGTPAISLTGNLDWTDYSMEVDVRSIQGVDRHILFRFTQFHVKGYSIKFRNEDLGVTGLIELQKHGQNVVLLTNHAFKTHIGATHRFKIAAVGNHIQVFADGNSEPVIDYIDNNQPILSGRVGFEIEPAGIPTTTQTGYDNLVVTDLSQTSTNLNVPDLKQFSLPWGPTEYDHQISRGGTNPTMERWGCAVTSAAMILQRHGHNIDPGTLNEWLKLNNGYNRSGGIQWQAVTKYTKNHDSANSPSLEFKYNEPSEILITNEIAAGNPLLFKLAKPSDKTNNHFIVGIGGTSQDGYSVNDPGSLTNDTLSESENNFGMNLYQVGTFTPSHTDLSYIVLYSDMNTDLKVFDLGNTEIQNGYFIEGGIVDAVDKTEASGVALNAFHLAKPQSGQYRIEIAGSGNYQFDLYLYDVNGNVKLENKTSTLNTTEKDIYLLNFNQTDSTNSITQEITFDELLQLLAESHSKGLIVNNGAYTSVKNMIDNSQVQLQKGKVEQSKQFLNSAVIKIQYHASFGEIDHATSLQLTQYIQLLTETY